MTAFPVRIGIDEFATETQKCDGWTYFCLPAQYVTEFTQDARSILSRSEPTAFHGKKFKKHLTAPYKEFLELIKAYIKKSMQACAVNTLLSDADKQQFCSFTNQTLNGTLSEAGVTSGPAYELLRPYVPPLFTLSRITDNLGPNIKMTIEMDEHESFGDLAQIVHQGPHAPISGHVLLASIYNAYKKKFFPKAPLMPENAISVVKDTKSFFVQAADVIGNFSMAYVFVKLKKKSKSREAKAALIEEVFGEEMAQWDFSRLILQNNDFIIDGGGHLDFKIRWFLTKGPDEE